MIFNEKIKPMCLYCERGKHIVNTTEVLCKKYGIVKENFFCKRFRYTPLKRTPPSRVLVPKFEHKDFEI